MGKDDPLTLRYGKVCDAILGDKGWYGIVDETYEEYMYPPELFESMSVLCPVFEKTVFVYEGDHDIYEICRWENDGVQGRDHDYWGGANDLSVNESKIEYELSLCAEKTDQLDILRDR